ncbi:uncharacterized protein LOC110027786 isoform X2 [Phalaenopsis equestris]|uniref:uncharacterized protein LOC110027786 isoform X2 n=1 Tax=Phalaenopsis equestris TaxID=78828 RepID=UPI0009E360DD|nr:uncharacterized protein LOC110027786 isoform X2 [Phalaenopsis equestris]
MPTFLFALSIGSTITSIHPFLPPDNEKARLNIEQRTKQYEKHAKKGRHKMIFEPGDWVWLHMKKKNFQDIDIPNYFQEEMVLSKYLSVSTTMPISWINQRRGMMK